MTAQQYILYFYMTIMTKDQRSSAPLQSVDHKWHKAEWNQLPMQR